MKIAGRVYSKGTECVIDKYDASRGYPFTTRVVATGDRGRVLPEEIEHITGAENDKEIAVLKPGDYFGEQALIRGSYRNASIIARGPGAAGGNGGCTCAILDIKHFQSTRLPEKIYFAKRKAVIARHEEDEMRVTAKAKSQEGPNDNALVKTPEEVQFIKQAILENKYLREVVIAVDDPADLEAMIRIAYKRKVKKGDVIIREGDLFADEFFIVSSHYH